MIDWKATANVFVNERECRAGHCDRRADFGDQALDELGLACTEGPDKGDHVAGAQAVGKIATRGFRLRWTIGNVSSHGAIFDFRFSIFEPDARSA